MDTYSFFCNGYIQGHSAIAEEKDWNQFNFVDCLKYDHIVDLVPIIDDRAAHYLDEIFVELESKYIKPMFDTYTRLESTMWEGVDPLSATWHNDYIKGKTFNSNILVYLDDGTVENGNFIEVRNQTEEFRIYPKAGDFVWLNQRHTFEHKATHTSGRRRLLCYELMIPGLL